MLRITPSQSADSAKKYYCESYYKEGRSAQLDYYGDKDQCIGSWGGRGAGMLGLHGDIRHRDFAALCDNIDPHSGNRLTARHNTKRTVGYDFTFSASKSVTLAYSFASDEDKQAILAAFHRAVRETMEEVEAGMQTRVRIAGKDENRLTGNIVYGEFTHFTTRPVEGVPDPHLHSHCFVFNATYDAQENKWKAGQFKQLKQDAPYYEAVFQSKFANGLQEAGFKTQRCKSGFELLGVSRDTIEKFSRRTRDIEDYAKAHNITDPAQKAAIGAKTREAKRITVSEAQQRAEWESRLSPQALAALRNLKQAPIRPTPNAEHEADRAVQYAVNHHFERKSVASDKEILATAIKASIGSASPEQVKGAFGRQNNLLMLVEDLRTLVTTKEALKEEKQLKAAAYEFVNRFRPIHPQYRPKNLALSDEQAAAVNHALSSTHGITIIAGRAGVGKTTLMQEVKNGIEESGKQIFAFAPSADASRGVQRSEGFENADTVAKLTLDKALQAALRNQVIWIDEAGMLSNKDMNRILMIAKEQSARVILSGDTRQHSSVERGDALRILQTHAGIVPITVSKIQRQQNEAYREAVKLLSDGSVEKGFKKLESMGAVHEIADTHARMDAIAADYHRSAYSGKGTVRNVLVVAPTHAEGEMATAYIRDRLKDAGALGKDERSFATLKNLQLTDAQKRHPENYQEGQIVQFFKHAKGIKAGARLQVMCADASGVTAKDTEGRFYRVPLAQADRFSVFEPGQAAFATGDKIRLTAKGKSLEGTHLFNGALYHITGFDASGNMQLSNGATLPKEYGHIQHGYVLTSHASQGKTADKVIIAQSAATFRAASMEQFYVSVSRGKYGVSIYTDDKAYLLETVSRSAQRMSATELVSRIEQQAKIARRQTIQLQWQQRAAGIYHYTRGALRELAYGRGR